MLHIPRNIGCDNELKIAARSGEYLSKFMRKTSAKEMNKERTSAQCNTLHRKDNSTCRCDRKLSAEPSSTSPRAPYTLSFVTVSRSLDRAEQLKRPQVDEKESERGEERRKGQLRVAIACSAQSETDHAGQRRLKGTADRQFLKFSLVKLIRARTKKVPHS